MVIEAIGLSRARDTIFIKINIYLIFFIYNFYETTELRTES